MKKIFIILSIIMVLGVFASCSDSNENNKLNDSIDNALPEYNWTCEVNVKENEDSTLTIDYLITSLDGKTTFTFTEKPLFDKSWYEMFKTNGGEICEFIDYNFDGYPDIKTQHYGAFVNQYYNIRIWNNTTGEFELNQEYMNISNPLVNEEKKQILGTNYDIRLGNYTLYEVKDGVLTGIATIKVTINEDGSYEYIETIGEGEPKTINSLSDLNEIWEGYNIQIV